MILNMIIINFNYKYLRLHKFQMTWMKVFPLNFSLYKIFPNANNWLFKLVMIVNKWQ